MSDFRFSVCVRKNEIFYFGVEPVVSNCLAAQYCVDSGTQNTRANRWPTGKRLCVVAFKKKIQISRF